MIETLLVCHYSGNARQQLPASKVTNSDIERLKEEGAVRELDGGILASTNLGKRWVKQLCDLELV